MWPGREECELDSGGDRSGFELASPLSGSQKVLQTASDSGPLEDGPHGTRIILKGSQ